jgi:lysophospholipase L1-like esterase
MLAGVAALPWAARGMYAVPAGRFSAKMIAVMRSRALLNNPGATGYYERLFETAAMARPKRIPDSFRVYRDPFAGPEYSSPKPSGTRRAALLGDSVVRGVGVAPDRNFGVLLENRLNATAHGEISRRFEVMNFGVVGYQLTQIMDVALEDAHRLQPDVYLLGLTELAIFRNWDEHLVKMIQLGLDPKYDFLRDVIRRAGARKEDDTLTLFGKLAPYRIPVLRQTLLEMKSRAAGDHALFLVLLIPCLEDGDLSRRRFDGIPELLASLDIPTIDLLDTFHGILDLDPLRTQPSDVHPNARGHEMLFENLYAKLRARPDLWAAVTGAPAE